MIKSQLTWCGMKCCIWAHCWRWRYLNNRTIDKVTPYNKRTDDKFTPDVMWCTRSTWLLLKSHLMWYAGRVVSECIAGIKESRTTGQGRESAQQNCRDASRHCTGQFYTSSNSLGHFSFWGERVRKKGRGRMGRKGEGIGKRRLQERRERKWVEGVPPLLMLHLTIVCILWPWLFFFGNMLLICDKCENDC